jgi:hypothetical protein
VTDTIIVQTETTQVVADSDPDDPTTLIVTSAPVTETVQVNIGTQGIRGPEGPQGETGAAGPAGPQGPAGESAGVTAFNGRSGAVQLQESDVTSVNTFSQEFMMPTATATITHNLGCFPSVTVINSSGETVMSDVQYIDQNNVQISFVGANVFTVYCN